MVMGGQSRDTGRRRENGYFRFPWLPVVCLLPGGIAVLAAEQPIAGSAPTFEKDVLPVLRKYCYPCHGEGIGTAAVSFKNLTTQAAAIKQVELWRRVARQLSLGQMPPANMPQPTRVQREAVLEWVRGALPSRADPGRPTIRRLNRSEYDNTIRDLVGVDFRPAADFPSDDVGYGFDNIGDVLSISPLLIEKYLSAARQIAEKAVVVPLNKTRRFEGESLRNADGGRLQPDGIWALYAQGAVYAEPDVQIAGSYRLRVVAFAQQAGPEIAKMAIRVDGVDQATLEVRAAKERPEAYDVPIALKVGKPRLAAAFLNDYYQPNDPNPRNRDRNLYIDAIELIGPFGAEGPMPESHRRIVFEQPTLENRPDVAAKIMREFARRAFRRPVPIQEAARYARLVELAMKEGETFEQGIRLAVQAVLVSPHFLFRVELDGRPNDPKAVRPLSGYELASRLSYFLWSSMPDERLFALAEDGSLAKPDVLSSEVSRMIRDPKARSLSDDFAEQWLQLRKLDIVSHDPELFPSAAALKPYMAVETKRFFEAVVREDRSVIDFLDARWTYVNEPLARLYGIEGVAGPEFRRVALASPRRGGVLTHASILTVTSNPDRTSPVKRGKWVMENLLGTPPAPPPPGVGNLSQEKASVAGKSLRRRLEIHRKDPACATCHAPMDGIGFSLENFDAVGAWRSRDGAFAIDPAGALAGGVKFNGPEQLRRVLVSKKDQFVRCLAEKLLTFATGRGMEPADDPAIASIVQQAASKGYKFSALANAVVQSDVFRMRRGDSGPRTVP